ncbi:hypothetical protein [Nonomuraea maheshkhaliensis]|uniref:hypothetical protein n=1 Tax=Nonomuraea maheshkhaliensis TaxID=419590 RepID=UPI0031F76528
MAAVGEASALRPTLLVIDDLQWADVTSLQLFGHLAARLPARTMVVGALRDRAPLPGTELSRMLAAVSRVSGQRRVHLGPLSPAEVAELVRGETGRTPGPRRPPRHPRPHRGQPVLRPRTCHAKSGSPDHHTYGKSGLSAFVRG